MDQSLRGEGGGRVEGGGRGEGGGKLAVVLQPIAMCIVAYMYGTSNSGTAGL